MQKGNN